MNIDYMRPSGHYYYPCLVRMCLVYLCLLLVFFCVPFNAQGAATTSTTSVEAAYQQNVRAMEALQRDSRRSTWREPWEDLAKRFESLYTNNPTWNARSHALLYTARAYDALARASGVRADTQKAYAYYDAFLRAYADSLGADKALMLSVRLAVAKHDGVEAKRRATILVREYPKSPYITVVKHLGGLNSLSATAFQKAESALVAKEFAATQASYQRIMDSMLALQKDARRSTWREPWESLAKRFKNLYDTKLDWPDRALALFGAAKAYDALSRRSGVDADTNRALDYYNLIVKNHPKHRIAETALVASVHFAAAKRNIAATQQRVTQLRKQFPKSAQLAEVEALLRAMGPEASSKKPTLAKSTPSKQPTKSVKKDVVKKAPLVEKTKKVTPLKKTTKLIKKVPAQKVPTREIIKRVVSNPILSDAHARIVLDMDALSRDTRRSTWREPWEKLAKRFIQLHDINKQWSDRALPLLDSARAYGALARRSGLAKDKKRAYAQYDAVVKRYPHDIAAGRALFRSIMLAADTHDRVELTRRTSQLGKKYPQSPYLLEARRLEAMPKLGTTASAKALAVAQIPLVATQGVQAVMERIAWTSNKGLVTITISYDKAVDWFVRASAPAKGKPTQLIIETPEVHTDKRIADKARVRKSLLTQVNIADAPLRRSIITLNLQGMRSFSVKSLASPFRLVITASSSPTVINDGVLVGGIVRALQKQPSKEPMARPKVKLAAIPKIDANFAAQLGLTVRTVVIDAGHGGKDPGAMHNGLVERDIVLDIAKKVGAILQKKGLKIIYTRQKDVWISLEDRANLPKERGADLFISIHMNANNNPKIHGFETYYLDFATSPAAKRLASVENAVGGRSLGALEGLLADMMLGLRRDESRRLATHLQDKTLRLLRDKKYTVNDGGIRGAPFHVLMDSGIPGVLVEVGYCSNKREAKRLKIAKYRTYLAQGIAEGILAYSKTFLQN